MLGRALFLVFIVLPSLAAADLPTLVLEGNVPRGATELPSSADTAATDLTGLVTDGSFEYGECDAGSAWACLSSTSCSWILDPLPVWGYPAHDGVLVVWLGGYCDNSRGYNTANENSFCMDLYIDGEELTWFWMGYVGLYREGDMAYVTIDGVYVWRHIMRLADHTYGLWQNLDGTLGTVDIHNFCHSTRYVCIGFHVLGQGSNMLVDYVEMRGSCYHTPTGAAFTTQRAPY